MASTTSPASTSACHGLSRNNIVDLLDGHFGGTGRGAVVAQTYGKQFPRETPTVERVAHNGLFRGQTTIKFTPMDPLIHRIHEKLGILLAQFLVWGQTQHLVGTHPDIPMVVVAEPVNAFPHSLRVDKNIDGVHPQALCNLLVCQISMLSLST
jgi:hypothetical protein